MIFGAKAQIIDWHTSLRAQTEYLILLQSVNLYSNFSSRPNDQMTKATI